MSSMMRLIVRTLITLVLIMVAAVSISVRAQDSLQAWENFDFGKQLIKTDQVSALSLDDLKFLRGIVFGRHGRIFKDAEIKDYLEKRSWYKPDAGFRNSVLNDTERQNLDVIRDAEAGKHPEIQPGDMRFYRNHLLTAKKWGRHSGAEWTVLAAEIEAIHGKRFDETPWLQAYFDERYWYKAADHYDPKQLTEIERKNLQAVVSAHKKQRRVALSPGDMEFFENKALSEAMLRGLSLHELRLLRNEIYARHGRLFKAAWLQQYFEGQPWYQYDENFKDEELSGADKQNVELVVNYENKIHRELSTKPVTRTLLEGLFLEDASQMRQEIYARHGKVFKEPWLQKYFASFDWYKANPNFTDASLTEIERRNIATIQAYEKRAATATSVIEG
ncbi:MAG TPA: YARHG domain-containing protein [Pyrinomonadaceae bacterium]|nr:YARHG domain-containing protein [Pyrinomonadaceae bacterium]